MSYRSPFGPLPRHWTVARLRDLTSKIGSGATPRGGEKAYLQERRRYALIRSQCVHDRRFDTSTVSYISDDQAKALRNAEVRSGDVLINITGDGVTFARSSIVPDDVLPACVNQHVSIVRPIRTLLAGQYLMSFLASPEVKPYIEGFNAGGSRRAITKGHIESFEIPLPPLAEQEAIGSMIGSFDDKIELNRRMNETLEAMAQAIFRDWFVDFGPTRRKTEGASDPVAIMGGLVTDAERAQQLSDLFPAGFGDNGLPEGWSYQSLLDQANWVNGAAYKNMHFSDDADALPVVKIAELKSGVTNTTKRTSTALGEKYRIKDKELLFSWSGNPDTSIDTFIWTGGDAWLNQHIFAVRQNGRRSHSSLYILLKHLKPQFAELARNKQTTGLGHVTKDDMKRLEIAEAPGAVERSFEALVAPLFEMLMLKLFENRTLATTRDILLPKLMSGEVRLQEAVELLEAAQ